MAKDSQANRMPKAKTVRRMKQPEKIHAEDSHKEPDQELIPQQSLLGQGDTIQSQASVLKDRRIPVAQRQAIARRIGSLTGNHHLRLVMARIDEEQHETRFQSGLQPPRHQEEIERDQQIVVQRQAIALAHVNASLRKDGSGTVTNPGNARFTLTIGPPPAGKYYHFRWSVRDHENNAYLMRSVEGDSVVQHFGSTKHAYINRPSLQSMYDRGASYGCRILVRIAETNSPTPPRPHASTSDLTTRVLSTSFDFVPDMLQFDRGRTRQLAQSSHEMLRVGQAVSAAQPRTQAERDQLEPQLRQLVKLNAIGLMNSHRLSIIGARDRLVRRRQTRQQSQQSGGQRQGQQSTGQREGQYVSPVQELRQAAEFLVELQRDKSQLQTYRRNLDTAYSQTISRRGDLNDVFNLIHANGTRWVTNQQMAGIRNSFAVAKRSGTRNDYWRFAIGASRSLRDLRAQQIVAVDQAISKVYQGFPVFAQLDPAMVSRQGATGQQTMQASEAAYRKLIGKVDQVIDKIRTGEVHPFELPKPVQVTRNSLSGQTRQALDEAVRSHQNKKSWINFGLSLLEIVAVALIPLGGLAGLAAAVNATAIGAGLTLANLENMINRMEVAEATTDPNDPAMGVSSPGTWEWVMFGVQGLLTTLGAAGIWRALRSRRAPTKQMLAEIGEPSEVGASANRYPEMPYHQPLEIARIRGQPLNLDGLNPRRKYLWAIDRRGTFIIAPESQRGFGITRLARRGREVKHGDLVPGFRGRSRGAARAGGELKAEMGADGRPTGRWIMDPRSSYSYDRIGGEELPFESLKAVKRLLGHYGTDTSRIVLRDFPRGR